MTKSSDGFLGKEGVSVASPVETAAKRARRQTEARNVTGLLRFGDITRL